MRTGRPKQPIILSKAEEEQLKSISRSRSFSHGLVTRAKIIIMSAEGTSNKDIARKLNYSPQSVSLKRRRFLEQGISGLHDELRSGTTTVHIGRTGGRTGSHDPSDKTQGPHPLEHPLHGRRNRHLPAHCAEDLECFWPSASSSAPF